MGYFQGLTVIITLLIIGTRTERLTKSFTEVNVTGRETKIYKNNNTTKTSRTTAGEGAMATNTTLGALTSGKKQNTSTIPDQTTAAYNVVNSECDNHVLMMSMTVGAICLFGTVGNSLSIAALRKTESKLASSFLLSSLMVSDTILLVGLFIMRVIPTFLIDIIPYKPFLTVFPYMLVYGWPMVSIANTLQSGVTVFITLYRYIAVCRPHQAPALCRTSRARRNLIILVVMVIIFNLPRFFDATVAYVGNRGIRKHTQFGLSGIYQVGYLTVTYLLFFYFIPLVMLIVMVNKLIRAIQQANKKREELTGYAAARDDVTKVQVAIVLAYLFCKVWNPIRRLIEVVQGGKSGCGSPYYYLAEVVPLTQVINSSINFIIYICFGRKFRQALITILMCNRTTTT